MQRNFIICLHMSFLKNIYLFGCDGSELLYANSDLWQVGSSSMTRDQIQAAWHWERGVLTTGLPRKSPHMRFFFFLNFEQVIILDFTGSCQNV